jgi:hypothetical protein
LLEEEGEARITVEEDGGPAACVEMIGGEEKEIMPTAPTNDAATTHTKAIEMTKDLLPMLKRSLPSPPFLPSSFLDITMRLEPMK